MSDFAKEKIGFAVALLAVLFTLSPIISDIGGSGFEIFGFQITVRLLYYGIAGFLTLAVYLYAVQFLTQQHIEAVGTAAHASYAVAIMIPPLFVALFIISVAGSLVRQEFVQQFAVPFAALGAGAASGVAAERLRRTLGRRERESEAQELEVQEYLFIERARSLLNSGFPDLAVVEAWKAVEVAVRRRVVRSGQRPVSGHEALRIAQEEGLIPPELARDLDALRHKRNQAAHEIEPVHEEEAVRLLELANRFLSAIEVADEEDDEGREEAA